MKGKIWLAEKRGFCSGVERAVSLVRTAVKEGPYPVRVLHEIVHNESVVQEFTKLGVQFFEEPAADWNGGTLILSAHGVGSALEEKIRSMPLKVIDATCPLVKRLHASAAELEQNGFTLLFAGKRKHRETEGVAGRLAHPPVILETPEEAEAFSPKQNTRYAVISQTTLSVDDYESIIRTMKLKIPELHVSGGICQATTSRQYAVKELAKHCKRILVVGSENSSNSRRLQEVAESAGANAILIPDANALPDSFFEESGDIGITGGASAPEHLITELIERFEACGWVRA